MEPTSHPMHAWWPSPSTHAMGSSAGDSDHHWDATVRLLALDDDDPVPEHYDGVINNKEPDDEDGGGLVATAVFQPHSFRCEPLGLAGDKTDFRLSASLSEEDIAFIVSSTSEDSVAQEQSPAAATATSTIATAPRRSAARRNSVAAAQGKASAVASTTSTVLLTVTPPEAAVMSSTEEARRERNRLKVRRLYYRKLVRLALLCDRFIVEHSLTLCVSGFYQDRLNGLRSEVADLEDQLENLKVATASSNNNNNKSERTAAGSSRPTVDYAALLQQLAQTKQRLQHENEYLRRVVSQYIRSVHAVSVKQLALHEPPTAYFNIKSVTRLECADLRRRTLTEVRNFARSRHLFQDVGRICGWQSMQIIQDGIFRFSIEKIMPGYSADEVAALSWAVLRDPPRLARVHSTAADMKCYVLQEVDDDNLVIFHEYRTMNSNEERATVVRIILLLSRVKTASGHVLTLTSFDRDKWVLEDHSASQLQDTVVWNDLFCWLQYRDVAGACVCTFAGFSPIIGTNVSFWMIEIVQLAVRWEGMTLGPEAYSLKTMGDANQSAQAGVEC